MEQMQAQLPTVYEQRKYAHEQLARLEGKSDEEKRVPALSLSLSLFLSLFLL